MHLLIIYLTANLLKLQVVAEAPSPAALNLPLPGMVYYTHWYPFAKFNGMEDLFDLDHVGIVSLLKAAIYDSNLQLHASV